MLILSRKVGENIMIGDSIRITLCLIKGNKVNLGIEAPEGIRIVRSKESAETNSKKERTDG